jgi:hypothetical protein
MKAGRMVVAKAASRWGLAAKRLMGQRETLAVRADTLKDLERRLIALSSPTSPLPLQTDNDRLQV